jgi:hypothetical protein
VARRIRQLNGGAGIHIRVLAVQFYDAEKGVDIGHDIDRVLREVGETVVFDRVNLGWE